MMGASSSSNGIRPTPISTNERAAKTYSENAPMNDRRQKSYIHKEENQSRSQVHFFHEKNTRFVSNLF